MSCVLKYTWSEKPDSVSVPGQQAFVPKPNLSAPLWRCGHNRSPSGAQPVAPNPAIIHTAPPELAPTDDFTITALTPPTFSSSQSFGLPVSTRVFLHLYHFPHFRIIEKKTMQIIYKNPNYVLLYILRSCVWF